MVQVQQFWNCLAYIVPVGKYGHTDTQELGFSLGEKGNKNKKLGSQRRTLGTGLKLEYQYEFVI